MTVAARILVSFAVTLLVAQPLSAATDAEFERLMELSGITRQVEEFRRGVRIGLEQGASQGSDIPADDLEKMLAGVDEQIEPKVILDEIRYAVIERLDSEGVSRLLKWYESELGQRVTQAQINAASQESMEQMMASADDLLAMEERVAWARRLDALLGGTDMNMAIQSGTGTAVYRALLTSMHPGEPVDLEPFEEQMQAVQPQLREMMEQLVTLRVVHTYRDFDTPSLARYESFLKDPLSVMFNKAVAQGMRAGMAKVVEAWIADVVRIASEEEAAAQ